MSAESSSIRDKMTEKGVMEAAIRSFERARDLVKNGESAVIPEADLEPARGVIDYETLLKVEKHEAELVGQTVVLKLNGGLGTSMGLEKVKSVLEVKPGVTFLDLMGRQILSLRKETGGEVKFLLMNSQATSGDTKGYLKSSVPELGDPNELELLQNWVPKLTRNTWEPVEWLQAPDQEWCPPGHADVYPSLAESGWLDRLLESGVKYAFLSNSDNLGAVLDPTLLSHFAKSEAPFLIEVTRRTEADRKGGHLATRARDERLILREVAQCPEDDLEAFQDIEKHQYFNTNNLWVNLQALKDVMDENGGVLPLPVMLNAKTVDPRDKESTPVYQLEQAMGTAIECFEGALAVCVPRSRFAPVKTTADLLALRSDAYELSEDGQIRLVEKRKGVPPVVKLSEEYKFVDGLQELGVPSLIDVTSFSVEGPFSFGEDVKLVGETSFVNKGGQRIALSDVVFEDDEYHVL